MKIKIPITYYRKIFAWGTIPFIKIPLNGWGNSRGGYYATLGMVLPEGYISEGSTIYKIEVLRGEI